MNSPLAKQPQPSFKIAIIGGGRSMADMVRTLGSLDFGRAFPLVELVGAAKTVFGPQDFPAKEDIETTLYEDHLELIASHPELNLILDLTDDDEFFLELRSSSPSHVCVANSKSARFLQLLLDSRQNQDRCENDLALATSLFYTVFDEVEEDIILLDTQGRIVNLNRNAHNRKGKSKNEILGLSCWELEGLNFCCENVNGRCPFRETLKTGIKSESVHSYVDSDGRMRYFRVYTYPVFDSHKNLSNIVEIRRDITSRTNMELRLQQSEKMAAIGELSTYIAHEIRNPLFAIAGFANSLLRSPDLNEPAREKVRIILDESKRLDRILKSTLNFAKPTVAKEEKVDLNKVAGESMKLLSLGLKEKGVDLRMELEQSMALAKGDPELIKQCLINLIKNAQEAISGGGVITIKTGRNERYVFLAVEDTGAGVPKEIRDKVFNPFFSTKDKGSGLGLAMTKKIIEDMGGEVVLASQEGSGTSITLFLPPVLALDMEGELA